MNSIMCVAMTANEVRTSRRTRQAVNDRGFDRPGPTAALQLGTAAR
jgi:hypothetical protein